uniref:Reverse transcriptase RNase H-like domain-containing protein n=1 Tax=Sinocyclocheilus anshuiensis TaxID=1608454 RepID=A0A671QI42_9TELE
EQTSTHDGKFAATQVEFLGFRVDKDGIKPTCEKVEAIQKAPPPRNKTELQAFLGLLNFYSCFLPNKATVLEPLHRLLDQSATWQWGAKHETAYVQKPLAVVCDASHYGLGALLFHLERDGQEKPICFASRTMTTTERNYAQIDKEALAVVFAVRKFHQYLAGRHFIYGHPARTNPRQNHGGTQHTAKGCTEVLCGSRVATKKREKHFCSYPSGVFGVSCG